MNTFTTNMDDDNTYIDKINDKNNIDLKFNISWSQFINEKVSLKSSLLKTNKISMGDCFWFHMIKIPSHIDLKKIYTFDIFINGYPTANIPFNLMINLSEIKKTNKYLIIKIPSSMVFKKKNTDILFYELMYGDIDFQLTGSCELVDNNYQMLSKHKFLKETRYYNKTNNYKTDDFEKCIKILSNNYLIFKFENTLSVDFEIEYNITGFFIETSYINKVSIFSNDVLLFDYSEEMIKQIGNKKTNTYYNQILSNNIVQTFSKILNNDIIEHIIIPYSQDTNLYWIPVSPFQSWDDENILSYISCSEIVPGYFFSKLKKIKIQFDSNNSGILYPQIFRYIKHASGLIM